MTLSIRNIVLVTHETMLFIVSNIGVNMSSFESFYSKWVCKSISNIIHNNCYYIVMTDGFDCEFFVLLIIISFVIIEKWTETNQD